ncbi:FAD-dependent oxidoreductase [Paraburkholderia panacisoli]|nr:FAD-dependent oxidoreductase [Paraburkholderia panacisoli]
MFAGSRRAREADVIVVGSGAAGLTAAILAHDHGANVAIVERSPYVGGTSAVSGGGIWIPTNSHMHEVGVADSRDEAFAYCKSLTMERVEHALLETFVDTAPTMIRYLEDKTDLRFTALSTPDYHPEVYGARGGGRSLEPVPFDARTLGDWQSRIRVPNALSFPVTLQEAFVTYQAFYRPWKVPQDLVVKRMANGLVTMGQALVAGLLKAVLDRRIPILLNSRANALLRDGGRIVGIRSVLNGQRVEMRARAVILASGGFEWNEDLKAKFLSGPIPAPNSPPINEGDGLLMAMEVGADLANLSEVWHYPSVAIPGETYEGREMVRGIKAERSGPHIIWVNGQGKRFVNEASSYNAVGKIFFSPDTSLPAYRNLPAWAIFDSQYRAKYVVGTTMPEDPDPEWLSKAETLEELANKVGIHPDGLADTVRRWNMFVAEGKDREFGKGDSAFDRFQGDHEASHPNLGTIERGPFYALPIQPGALGTKGGPRTDCRAQVLSVRGEPICGLYAAGNVAASIAGPAYFGVGGTLGPAMTWGYLAGLNAAKET